MISIFIAIFAWQVTAQASPIDGVWRQECRSKIMREENIEGEKAILSENAFEDYLCSEPSYVILNEGTIVLGSELPSPAGAQEIDFTFKSVSIVLYSEPYVRHFNQASMCGLTNWIAGEPREITGLGCTFFGPRIKVPSRGDQRFGIFRLVNEDYLFFGALSPDQDASTPARRPKVYDPFAYRRVIQTPRSLKNEFLSRDLF